MRLVAIEIKFSPPLPDAMFTPFHRKDEGGYVYRIYRLGKTLPCIAGASGGLDKGKAIRLAKSAAKHKGFTHVSIDGDSVERVVN